MVPFMWLAQKTRNILFQSVLWLKKPCKVSVVQSLSFVQLFGTPWTIALQASLSFTVSWSLLKLTFTESVQSKCLILCRPFSSCLQTFPASGSFVMSWFFALGGQSIGASFSISISPSNGYSGFISFRIDRFDLLAVQGTLKSLLQHHSLKTSVLQCSVFFMVQLSHLYMATGKHGIFD